MKLKILCFLVTGTFFIACDGQGKKESCSSDVAIRTINDFPEIKKTQKYIDSISHHKHGVSFMVDNETFRGKDYFIVKTGYNGDLRWEPIYIFYVDKKDCAISYLDTTSNKLLTLEQWRANATKQNHNMEPIEFNNLFSDDTVIKFTPSELNKNTPETEAFKKKLKLFESQHPLPEDFETADLNVLINNETFVNNERFIDSSWLEYFINKYKINGNSLYKLLDVAIEQEDLNAIKIIISKGCIVSVKQINTAQKIAQYYRSLGGKIDTEEFYDPAFSKISQILPYLESSLLKNHIQDPDGYTNLRAGKSTSAEIIQKINSGEKISVLDNSGEWFLIKTQAGKEGYVHRSRIKAF